MEIDKTKCKRCGLTMGEHPVSETQGIPEPYRTPFMEGVDQGMPRSCEWFQDPDFGTHEGEINAGTDDVEHLAVDLPEPPRSQLHGVSVGGYADDDDDTGV